MPTIELRPPPLDFQTPVGPDYLPNCVENPNHYTDLNSFLSFAGVTNVRLTLICKHFPYITHKTAKEK